MLADHWTMRRLLARRHTALLVTIISMFAVRPFLGDTGVSALVFSVAVLAVLFASLATIHADETIADRDARVAQRRRFEAGWLLALPAVAERVWLFVHPDPGVMMVGAAVWFAFFSYVVWCQIRSLVRQRSVTGETISMSISVYLLLGLCWSFVYVIIYLRHPDAFDFGTSAAVSGRHVLSVFVYFSMTTLSTIGSGDIAPVALQARYAVVVESIMGQFYMAILVARLVGLHMTNTPTVPSAHGGSGSGAPGA